ncbi:DnaJ domain-containing protein [Cyanobium sp. FGCU-6]|nr:DnaJ domain-containing protein [Cyanobium sp. FGCU6]
MFALHGPRAPDLLDRQALGLVDELLAALGIGHRRDHGQAHRERAADSPLDRREKALAVLGLQRGASREAVKAAHRRLVKRHHPDVGGEVETFHRIDAAYRLLIT